MKHFVAGSWKCVERWQDQVFTKVNHLNIITWISLLQLNFCPLLTSKTYSTCCIITYKHIAFNILANCCAFSCQLTPKYNILQTPHYIHQLAFNLLCCLFAEQLVCSWFIRYSMLNADYCTYRIHVDYCSFKGQLQYLCYTE